MVGDLLLITEQKLKGKQDFLGLLKYEFDVLCRHKMRSNSLKPLVVSIQMKHFFIIMNYITAEKYESF